MIARLKRKLWPCRHSVNMQPAGLITHKSLRVSSTLIVGDRYLCSVWCRRCQTLVMRFEGVLGERKLEGKRELIDAPMIVADRDLWS